MKTLRSWVKGRQFFIWFLAVLACGPEIFAQTTGSVTIIGPKNGEVFYTPTNILLTAVSSPGGLPLEFFAGTNDLGPGVPYLSGGIVVTDYSLTWTNPPVGYYALTAVVHYGGIAITSEPVNIIVLTGPPPTNLPPVVVNIFAPQDGDVFYTPTNTQILAKASDVDGTVTNVEFFAGTNDLGSGTPVVLDPPGVNGVTGPVWVLNWPNVPVGVYSLTAVATDDRGASTISDAIVIIVLPGPPTNLPPVVRMVSPANGSIFHAPINIPLFAFACDPDGSVASVEFFAGTNGLGLGQRVPVAVPLASGGMVIGGPVPPIYPTNLFFLIWSNAPVGIYPLTAVATDNGGLSSTSAPVNIAILPPLPPPTNHPPIVSIVATDPVAIEGTNCWVWPGETNSPPTWAAWPTAVCQLFTNCGPKTATFTVRRFGDTNDDLTVPYDIGGTASNGVDYVALPGFVTVPAGERCSLITIVPIDDGPPDVNKTVILTLTPSTNTPPDYLLGFPQRAAAIIIDHGPCPMTGMLPGGCFHLVTPGPDAAWFCVEYSTDMVNWTPVCTNQVINGSIDFVDPDAQGNPSRFYRAVPLTGPPSD